MRNPFRSSFFRFMMLGTGLIAVLVFCNAGRTRASADPSDPFRTSYRVLAPIESGNLLLFPVVESSKTSATPFITLDEGIKSGQVEVTEAGNVRGLVRPRPAHRGVDQPSYRGDQVNTLVLINNSDKPLLLLAGEIVTGGKQDRIVGKDRIVPAQSDPIDLGVFCIEHGRWTEDTATFQPSAKASAQSLMVQPSVRAKAMVDKNQQEVWDSVHGSIAAALAAPASPARNSAAEPWHPAPDSSSLGTTSYARAMQNSAISGKVDEAAAPLMKSRSQVLDKLREEHAVGVVVAVRGELVWADIFSDTDLLSRYWIKLVRSYAAESLTTERVHATPSIADAQHFLDAPEGGSETSIGTVGVYRYRELRSGATETFILESLLPGTDYDVHLSKVKLRGEVQRAESPFMVR